MVQALDIAAMLSALAASLLWFKASQASVRRVSAAEEIDHHDFNRLVVSFNRVQLWNARAALATAISALIVAARFAVTAWAV